MPLLALLLSCADPGPPTWVALPALTLTPGEGPTTVDLSAWVEGGAGPLRYASRGDGTVVAENLGARLLVAADPDFVGTAEVELVVTDRRDRAATATLAVTVGAAACPVRLTWQASSEAVAAVALEGELAAIVPDPAYAPQGDGTWALDLALPPGAWPYRVAEEVAYSQATETQRWCDPAAAQIHCPAGYKEPWETDWTHDCAVPDPACDSLLVVPDCTVPRLEVAAHEVDRAAGSLSLQVEVVPAASGAAVTGLSVLLDGEGVPATLEGSTFHVERSGLAAGRHTLRATATDAAGATSAELWVPFWTDVEDPRDGFRDGPMYYAFVDRLADGDASNSGGEGATATIADFAGGDFAGLREALPYLDELGVRTVWISNPQDNAEGAWPGQCEAEFAGYHAYWPDQARAVEEHFGTDEELHALVEEAHARGMRVVMDWVANHVHEDHPYAAREDWFNPQALCEDGDNWNAIPEECWFAPYLPDLDYTRVDVLTTMLDDALWWARTYDLDGLRVDAAKHMPHSVQWNLEARVQAEIEHTAAGGDEEFWTVGETFDGAERIAAYVGEDQLDGQFDFPLYWAVRGALGTRSASPWDLAATMADGAARYDGALMSAFLGNHDVPRFTTEVAWGGGGACGGDPFLQAGLLDEEDPTWDRLVLAWAFVLTRPDVPLVYYGDELGMPGFGDPDNRQPLWWLTGGTPTSVAGVQAGVQATTGATAPAEVLAAVAALGQARRTHPALYRGTETEWWVDEDVLAWARVDGDDAALVVLNASDQDRTLENGATFALLPASGSLVDVLDGQRVTWSDDRLSVWVPARGARVLIRE